MQPAERPTSVRYIIVAVVTLMSFLLYLDRFCVSFAADYIRQDLDLSQKQINFFLSAFFWSYALAQVPSGWLSDRFGARSILASYILTWSIFTAWIGAAESFLILMIARVGCGLGQAGAYPTAAAVVRRWMPLEARGMASSFVANGGRIGAAIAPVLTAYLMVLFVPINTPVQLHISDVLAPAPIARWFGDPDNSMKLQRPLSATATGLFTKLSHDPEISPDEKFELAQVLNGIIHSESIYKRSTMSNISLPSEALRIVDRLEHADFVSQEEKHRLNRLVLEALFPKDMKRLYGLGWRPILKFFGLAGIAVAFVYWVLFRESPNSHPRTNEAERNLINEGRDSSTATPQKLEVVPIGIFLTSRNMWANSIMQFGTNIGWLFIVTLLPRFLHEVYNVPIIERGYMTMIPSLIGILGLVIGGKLTDIWGQRFGLKWGRRLPILVSRVTAILAYLGCIGVTLLPPDSVWNSPWTITALCAIAAFSTDLGVAPTWAFVQDVGGRHTGSVLGWGNMWGNLGAAAAPLLYHLALGETPSIIDWNVMFGLCAGSFILSCGCALAIDATQPVFSEAATTEEKSS